VLLSNLLCFRKAFFASVFAPFQVSLEYADLLEVFEAFPTIAASIQSIVQMRKAILADGAGRSTSSPKVAPLSSASLFL
jgi:hypothetical protein